MKLVKILSVIALLILSKFATAQLINLETVMYPFAPKENGEILLNYNQPTTIYATFTVSRALSATTNLWPDLPIKAEIGLYLLNSSGPNTQISVINISNSDWYGPQYAASKVIEKEIVIPAGAVTLANPSTSILAQWRFYKEGYPSPYNINGWTDWVNKMYTPVKLNPNQIPGSTFTGPASICDEGIYTISNPYTVSLENASGIATLTALGNNQWKVTRIGTANGVVSLRSIKNGKIFEREIMIGARINGGISGSTTVFPGKSYEYNLTLNDNISNYQNLTFTGTSGMNVQIISPTKVKYTVLSNYAFAPGETERNTTIQVTANIPGCGYATIEFPIVVINPKPTQVN
ncbi:MULTISPECIES: hypothetical protein [unclassified Sphingobacterium]|uniref:hypothetical protein n=1 Tax=unclassified Sphingobacterium TaxID=2609468 RepID=UPI0025D0F8EF|nr:MULTISPECIES: hypothetical protein [unclassified Sphingobacterium]